MQRGLLEFCNISTVLKFKCCAGLTRSGTLTYVFVHKDKTTWKRAESQSSPILKQGSKFVGFRGIMCIFMQAQLNADSVLKSR